MANVSQMDNGLKNADDLLRGIFSHMGNVGLKLSPRGHPGAFHLDCVGRPGADPRASAMGSFRSSQNQLCSLRDHFPAKVLDEVAGSESPRGDTFHHILSGIIIKPGYSGVTQASADSLLSWPS